jgi:hypothetical protein
VIGRIYSISVCPTCGDGPLAFDPEGSDKEEGMAPRAICTNGHVVIDHEARRQEVVPKMSLCTCGTPKAWRCPLHIL